MSLLELAKRCEAATEGDRELDVAIWLHCCGPADREAYEAGLEISEQEAAFRADYMMDGARYTASIDAALTLVPEGASYDLRTAQTAPGALAMIHPTRMRPTVTVRGNTPALAICAAALRARDA